MKAQLEWIIRHRVAAVAAASLGWTVGPQPQRPLKCEDQKDKKQPRIIFLGTGSSTGCPRPLCPMVFGSSSDANESVKAIKTDLANQCTVSNLAMEGEDPAKNKNYRNNPSLVIVTGDNKNIIIDTGKTFREGALRWFPRHNIHSLDAIILTHHHMDAAGGLDDVRGFQMWQRLGGKLTAIPMPLYLSRPCLIDLQERFPWLLPKAAELSPPNGDKPIVERFVASFDVNVIEDLQPFHVEGLTVVPLPVMHGEDLVSYGYAFKLGKLNIVYLSDISRMLPETLDYILNKLPPTDILVLDALHPDRTNPVHYNLEQAMELAIKIRPKQTFLVGMNCDTFLPHDEMNQVLKKKYGNVQLAHDGLVIDASRKI